MTDFVSQMRNELVNSGGNRSVTENGALGFRTTGKSLLDLNFSLSSMRNMPENEIWARFLSAYNENPELAVAWLFFARDIRGGSGERRTFRAIFSRLCDENPEICLRLLKLIPEYGRWDDLTGLFGSVRNEKVREAVIRIIRTRTDADLAAMKGGKPVSLLAKWMPSAVTSSKETRKAADELRLALGMTPRHYRKTYADLRRYLDVTERHMSASEWDKISYGSVPSRAAMQYRSAFMRHDPNRYSAYLEDVKSGKETIHSGTLFPHDIVHAYMKNYWDDLRPLDQTLEAQWDALPGELPPDRGTLVVVDGSGSMCSRIGNTEVTCHDVARALGIYFAERLRGPYADTVITFSERPHVVRLDPSLTLRSKIQVLSEEQDISNTNLEKTFDLILRTAVINHLGQDELPANVLIVSDMEFDAVTQMYDVINGHHVMHGADRTLFETIAAKFAEHGYRVPRLVFWNVCSRTGTIPVRENDLGVALVSGFSPAIADMVLSGETDPWKVLVAKLTSDRYQPVLREMGYKDGE